MSVTPSACFPIVRSNAPKLSSNTALRIRNLRSQIPPQSRFTSVNCTSISQGSWFPASEAILSIAWRALGPPNQWESGGPGRKSGTERGTLEGWGQNWSKDSIAGTDWSPHFNPSDSPSRSRCLIYWACIKCISLPVLRQGEHGLDLELLQKAVATIPTTKAHEGRAALLPGGSVGLEAGQAKMRKARTPISAWEAPSSLQGTMHLWLWYHNLCPSHLCLRNRNL